MALAVSTGLAAQVNQSEPSAKQKSAPSQVQILDLPLPVQIIEGQVKKDSDRAVQERTENRERDDLLAQQGMKDAADRMADSSYAQTWLIGIGTFLLFITLLLTYQANRAAQAAVTVTREIGEQQSRAYVFVHEPKRTKRDEHDPWEIEIHIKNFGQTPAYGAIADTDYTITETVDAKSFTPPAPRVKGKRTDIGPGHFFIIRFEVPELSDPSIWAMFKRRQKTLFVWGCVNFTDAFGHERWMTFRLYQGGHYIRNLMFCPEGNETSETPKKKA